jgi:adenylate cyclase
VDLRNSTQLAEHRLPFDTVFVINGFLAAVGKAVAAAGGQANQMLGDGMLVLFGLRCGREEAARQALAASPATCADWETSSPRIHRNPWSTASASMGAR